MEKWFLLDTNVTPPTRVLQPVTTFLPDFLNEAAPDQRKKARDQWWSCFEKMTSALRQAATHVFAGNASKLMPYQFSVTENEIRTGLLALPPQTRSDMCLWFKRNITDLGKHIAAGDKRVGAFTDLVWGTTTVDPEAESLLGALRTRDVPAALPAANLREYDVEFAPGVGIDPSDPKHSVYLTKLVSDFNELLTSSISANLAKLPKYSVLEEEILQHLIRARDIGNTFGGRRGMLDSVRSYLRSPDLCAPLVLHGDSGCGKSSVMAAIASLAREELSAKRISGCAGGTSGAVVLRFVGLTSSSSDVSRFFLCIARGAHPPACSPASCTNSVSSCCCPARTTRTSTICSAHF